MAIRGNPDEIAAKWAQRTSASTDAYQAGIQRVSQAPGAAAAAKADKWQQAVSQARDKYRARVGSVSLADWQQAALQKGASRFAAGAQASQNKMSAFLREFVPHLEAVTQRVRSMPDTTLEQRLERARQQALLTAQFRRRGGVSGPSA
jgi:hypothetical protein